jgi:hypothetical protein
MYEDVSGYNLTAGNPQPTYEDEVPRSPTSDSSNFRSTSPGRLNIGGFFIWSLLGFLIKLKFLGTRTPRRKVSSVLAYPQTGNNPTTAAVCLFYHSEPLNAVVNDIKTWWSSNNNMSEAGEFGYSN